MVVTGTPVRPPAARLDPSELDTIICEVPAGSSFTNTNIENPFLQAHHQAPDSPTFEDLSPAVLRDSLHIDVDEEAANVHDGTEKKTLFLSPPRESRIPRPLSARGRPPRSPPVPPRSSPRSPPVMDFATGEDFDTPRGPPSTYDSLTLDWNKENHSETMDVNIKNNSPGNWLGSIKKNSARAIGKAEASAAEVHAVSFTDARSPLGPRVFKPKRNSVVPLGELQNGRTPPLPGTSKWY